MLSKRANVFYLEHARVMMMDERIVYLSGDPARRDEARSYFNIPERNTAFLLLGKGTSITDAAFRRLSESNVVVGFCGTGGSPLFGALDLAFLVPQSEYRPTEYMQKWMRLWANEELRLRAAKMLLQQRAAITLRTWNSDADLLRARIELSQSAVHDFTQQVEFAGSTADLLLIEARWAKALYGSLARGFRFDFARQEGARATETRGDIANALLDHGNYIAYGYAAVALCGLGISFALPVLHGKTRRGALVFDVADLIKDAHVMPLAFACARTGDRTREFRAALIERCQDAEVLDLLFDFVSGVSEIAI